MYVWGMDTRKGGFYWVKVNGIWTIGHWVTHSINNNGLWAFSSQFILLELKNQNLVDCLFTSSVLQQIDERQIINPNL